ncbi:unnamed protein product, partial [Ranitomeya imitator]
MANNRKYSQLGCTETLLMISRVESAQQRHRSQRLAQSHSVHRVTAAFPASAIEVSVGQRRLSPAFLFLSMPRARSPVGNRGSHAQLAKTYGPVYSIKIRVQEMVVLSGYDIVKEALVNRAEMFTDRPNIPVFMDSSKGYDLASNMELVTVLLSIIVIIFLAKAFNNQKQGKYKNFPPGPKPLPILGNILSLDMSKPHITFHQKKNLGEKMFALIFTSYLSLQLSKQYGPVFSVHIGMTKQVLLCGYDTIKDALINNADVFSDRPDTPMFTKATKDHGVVFAKGENWKVMRRFALSTLRDYGMGKRTIEEKIIEEAECLAEKFRSYE